MKIQCAEPCCRGWGELRKPPSFHATCARQAGLEVENRPREDGYGYDFYVKCFRHGSNMFNLRARLEDLIEIEKRRSGKVLESKDTKTMSFVHASRLLNASILVLHTLGWAWRWAEWWVLYRDSWEPLLEPGQMEEEMTNEEKRIVESTPESRCEDARKCRLAALAAALRNRSFDDVDEGDTIMLDRALRAMLHTKSLVGPLEEWEIDFFAEWLGIAYRSKSRLLGFAEYKIDIRPSRGCVLEGPENTPKFELGSRRLPGAQVLAVGEVFESDFDDMDDFLKPETLKDGTPVTGDMLNSKQIPQKLPTKRKADSTEPSQPVLASPKKRVRPAKSDDLGNVMSFDDVKSENSFGSHRNLQLDLETAPESERKQENIFLRKEMSGKKRGRPPQKVIPGSAHTPDKILSNVFPSFATGPKRGRPSKEKPTLDVSKESLDNKNADAGANQCVGQERVSDTMKFEGTKPCQQTLLSSTVLNEPEVVKRKAGRPKARLSKIMRLDRSSEIPKAVAQLFAIDGIDDKQGAGECKVARSQATITQVMNLNGSTVELGLEKPFVNVAVVEDLVNQGAIEYRPYRRKSTPITFVDHAESFDNVEDDTLECSRRKRVPIDFRVEDWVSETHSVVKRKVGHRKAESTNILCQDEFTIGEVIQSDGHCSNPATTHVYSDELPTDNTNAEDVQADSHEVQVSADGGGKFIGDLDLQRQVIKKERRISAPIRFLNEDSEYDEDTEL